MHFCEELFILYKLGFELLIILLVHAELASAAGVGVGIT